MDPDPGGPKTHGSGSATLLETLSEMTSPGLALWADVASHGDLLRLGRVRVAETHAQAAPASLALAPPSVAREPHAYQARLPS
jgi:hypothetical protein